jgi:glutamate synthase (NADPH/NADH) large chain
MNHEALANRELGIDPLDDKDAAKLRELLETHVAETGSGLATRILADFASEVANFTRVLPRDYASVLSIRDKAVAAGVDPDGAEVWSQILEVTNG